MKNKRFIAKCLTLAMIFALMIPTPVSAASSKGRLLKSVTYYDYTSSNRFQKEQTTSYTYNKKNYPKEIKITSFSSHFLGIPMNATQTVLKTKYKFKGKTPKSMKLKNTAGVVTSTRKYKKGNLVSASGTDKYSWDDGDWDDNDNYISKEVTQVNTSNSSYTYNKKGLPVSSAYSWTNTQSGKTPTSGGGNITYTVTHKKGIPSQILKSTLTQGNTTPRVGYARFNNKGLVTETGSVDTDSATGAQKFNRQYRVVYKTKKGRVTQATIYYTEAWDENGNVTKEKPYGMYKFKYTKKKASKSRYFKMINSEVGYFSDYYDYNDAYNVDYFNWY